MSPVTGLQQLLAEHNKRSPEARQIVGQWQGQVQALCLLIEGWLAPLRESGDLLIDRTQNEHTDYELGSYTTVGLNLRFMAFPGAVTLMAKSPSVTGIRLPGGASRRGFRGRVDLNYIAAQVPLALDKDEHWVIGAESGALPLTEETLTDALKTLLNI